MSVDIFNNLINSYKTVLAFGCENSKIRFKKLFGLGDKIANEIPLIVGFVIAAILGVNLGKVLLQKWKDSWSKKTYLW